MTALFEFEQEHEDIFNAYRELTEELTVAEDEVKTYVKDNGVNLESKLFTAEYGESFRKYYDAVKLSKLLVGYSQKAYDRAVAMGLFVTTRTVDEKVLKALVKLNKIPADLAQKAFRKEPLGTRATIKRKV